VDKEEFIKLYLLPKVTMPFDKAAFLYDTNIILREGEVKLEDIGNYYCPWYYNVISGAEIHKGIKAILGDPNARAVIIKDVESRIKSRRNEIEEYSRRLQGKTKNELDPFPVATDAKLQKSLVLDGNRTLVALYKSGDRGRQIPVVEIYGSDLARIIQDFGVMSRD
jgi:hypothetical protein